MRRSIFKHALVRSAGLLTIVNILATGVTMLSGLYVARQFDTAQYGQYAYMANVFLLMTLVLGCGLTGQIAKDVAERQPGAIDQLRQRVGGLVGLRLLSGALAAVGGAILTWISGERAFAYAGAGATLFMWTDFVIGALGGLGRITTVAALWAIQPCAFLGAVLIVTLNSVHDLYRLFLLSQLLSATGASIAWLCHAELRMLPRPAQLRRLHWRTMVAGHVYLAVLVQTAYSAFGVTLLGARGQYAAAGEVSVALTLVRMLPLVSGALINVVYYPRLCRLHHQGDHAAFRQTTQLAYTLAAGAAAGAAALLAVYADAIVPLLYTARHAAAIPFVQLLAALCFFGVADQVLTWALVASNRSWRALGPLLTRLLVLLPAWPIALLTDHTHAAWIVVAAYVVSAAIGWLLQLIAADRRVVWQRIGLPLAFCGWGTLLGLGMRFVLPHADQIVQIAGLCGAALVYLLGCAVLAWRVRRVSLILHWERA